MTKIQFKVLDKPWLLLILSTASYIRRNGSDSIASTHVNGRRIELSPLGLDKETITHELVHAYLGELCTHSADLARDAFEEIFAELMAKRGIELLELAEHLHRGMAVLSGKGKSKRRINA
jgi:hypothetical protein